MLTIVETEVAKLLEFFYSGEFRIYIKPLLAFCISFFLLFFSVKFLSSRLKDIAKSTANTLDDIIADALVETRGFILLAASLYIGSRFISLAPETRETANTLIATALIIQAVLWLGKIVSGYLSNNYEKWNITISQTKISIFFLRLVLWSVAVLLILENLGIRVTPLLAGLGIGGIAVALAVQSILGEVIASVSIIIDKPFVVGDFIVVDGFRGIVEKVGLKTTRIRSISGELVVFSNNHLVSTTIQNYRNLPRRRSFSTVGVVYGIDPDKLAKIPQIIKNIIDEHPQTEYERVHFVAFADFSLNFEVAYYVLTSDFIVYLDAVQDINLEIIRKFRDERIDFAYPTQTVFAGKPVEVAMKNQVEN
ncbi:MAG: mechanosensitive ion channel [Candidatus Mycalebacterium zealandia]|nr:MAG: mechanosensitive ion channel [Candidatus Mycalebacterium zealandia]